jgi:glycerol-3-phosphate acyltransferase PlsY
MLWIIPGIIISYLIGSMPTAYIFGRLLKGIDIRKFGSGNVGATNALRVLGKLPGITVLVLDMLKGFVAVVFLAGLIAPKITALSTENLRIILGAACIFGHSWTVFLRFKGGKGVATTLGVIAGLATKMPGLTVVLAVMLLTWVLVFIFTRIVSLASLCAALSLPITTIFLRRSFSLISISIILSIFIIFRHKNNLKRLLAGKEPRLNFK